MRFNIGSTPTLSKIGDYAVYPYLKKEQISELARNRGIDDVPLYKQEVSKLKGANARHKESNFTSTIAKVFKAEILLPFFAHVDLQTHSGVGISVFPIVKILQSALLYSEKAQSDFADSILILNHLLHQADAKHINHKLFQEFFSMSCEFTNQKLFNKFIQFLLMDFALWSKASDCDRILEMIVNVIFPENFDFICSFLTVSRLIDAMQRYFPQNQKCRKLIGRLCLNQNCTHHDFPILVGHCVKSKNLFWLLQEITPPPDSAIDSLLHSLPNSDAEVISDCFQTLLKYTKDPRIYEIAGHLVSNFIGEFEFAPELFSIFCQTIYYSKNFDRLDTIEPSPTLVTKPTWSVWGIEAAIAHRNNKMFEFLCKCSSAEWANLYGTVEVCCQLRAIRSDDHLSRLLFIMADLDPKSFFPLACQFFFLDTNEMHELRRQYEQSQFYNYDQIIENGKFSLCESWSSLCKMGSKIFETELLHSDFVFRPKTITDIELAKRTLEITDDPNFRCILAAFIPDFPIDELSECPALEFFKKLHHLEYNAELAFESIESFGKIEAESNLTQISRQIVSFSTQCFDFFLSIPKLSVREYEEQNYSRLWYRFYSNASSFGGPWDMSRSTGISPVLHWKRDSSVCSNFLPMKMKRNKHFTDHMDAVLLRDSGSQDAASAKLSLIKKEMAEKIRAEGKSKLFIIPDEEEKPDFILPREDNLEDRKFACDLIKITGEKSAVFTISTENFKIKTNTNNKVYKFEPREIRHILLRNKYHQPTAIEIFLTNQKAFFLNFSEENTHIVRLIASFELPNAVFVQKQQHARYWATLPFTEEWINGRLSNFDYVLMLNLFSGRSFSDASLYPFMPWIFIDFTSPNFAITDSATQFRDLTKCVGALGEQRLDELKTRYKYMHEFNQVPYLFSSFAVCPLSLYLWMIRIEPFTSLHIEMQSKKFDHAARIFGNIEETYKLVTHHMNDYRELIPDFYFCPEFLKNSNHFNLGDVHGIVVDDVVLPPWAHNQDPMKFVYFWRKAFESDYVSANLNHWIDLVWGKKSRRPFSQEADNIYQIEMYDEIWKDNTIDDARAAEIKAIQCHVGTIPPQLFKNLHPTRKNFQFQPALSTEFASVPIGHVVKKCVIEDHSSKLRIYTVFDDIKPERFDVEFKNGQPIVSENLAIEQIQKPKFLLSVEEETVLCVSGQGSLEYRIPFYGDAICCLDVNEDFGLIVVGTSSSTIVTISLFDGTKVNVLNLPDQFVPKRVIVTHNWGFVVVYATTDQAQKLFVFNVNGMPIFSKTVTWKLSTWTSWTSYKGFDYLIAGTENGRLLEMDAFELDEKEIVIRQFVPVVGIHYLRENGVVCGVLDSGNIIFIQKAQRE